MQEFQRRLGVDLRRDLWRSVISSRCSFPEGSCAHEVYAFEMPLMSFGVTGAAFEGKEAQFGGIDVANQLADFCVEDGMGEGPG